MRRDYLKPGMVVVTTDFEIADLFYDTEERLRIELRNPENRIRHFSESFPEVEVANALKSQLVITLYDIHDIRKIIDDGFDTTYRYVRLETYKILMIFDRPLGSKTCNANNIEDLLRNRDLIWVSPNYHLLINTLSEVSDKSLRCECTKRGIRLQS